MGKRKGRQHETAFTIFIDAEFKARFYDRRDHGPARRRNAPPRRARSQGARHQECAKAPQPATLEFSEIADAADRLDIRTRDLLFMYQGKYSLRTALREHLPDGCLR